MIKFNEPYMAGHELQYIKNVIERGHYYGNGYYTGRCETLIKQTLNSNKVLLTDSCTSALEIIALLLRDWETDQEVIVPSYTFASTAAAFARAGYKVIFCEIKPDTMMIDLNDAERHITPKTVAIVGVHYGGSVFDVIEATRLCKKYEIKLIEDAAQAYGCWLENKSVGTFGDFSAFSFHETKNLHCGLGGALLINNAEYYARASYIWERGTNRQEVLKGLVDKYSWVEIGGSHYPSELQAAFLYAQLEKQEINQFERQKIYGPYEQVFSECGLSGLTLVTHAPELRSNYHAFWILFASAVECDYVQDYLKNSGINAFIGYVPLHSSPVGIRMGYSKSDLPITEHYADRILRLPLHNNLTPTQTRYIANQTVRAINEFRGSI